MLNDLQRFWFNPRIMEVLQCFMLLSFLETYFSAPYTYTHSPMCRDVWRSSLKSSIYFEWSRARWRRHQCNLARRRRWSRGVASRSRHGGMTVAFTLWTCTSGRYAEASLFSFNSIFLVGRDTHLLSQTKIWFCSSCRIPLFHPFNRMRVFFTA